ncbi:helix-turn-helix domain-containing protein [Micromonospora sp. PLK6-60]|uniref:helix-turn-helix domain-containing protein n=1 Tax=Micromonospora sp. PLK6-60 TaxID=2873383 RepID=UPI001CA7056F|nr:helix-turn-helix transcriptional regulator [Micromonospora sp. PLK6-60]MBY8873025.1 helix-turn-helix domain-containing protein [Micromonospora sp. PLK6-60]
MATGKDLPDVGGFIRDLRRNAKISLRQLADQAGVSNPYLSQIERGLRKPSAEVLQQLASALRVSTPAMYLRAGLLDDKEAKGVLAAIAVDPDLTMAQKQSLTQIYETFRRENARLAEATTAAEQAGATTAAEQAGAAPEAPTPSEPAQPTGAAATVTPAATGPATPEGAPTEAVLESVAVTEAGPAPAPTTRNPARKAAPTAAPKAAPAAEEEK